LNAFAGGIEISAWLFVPDGQAARLPAITMASLKARTALTRLIDYSRDLWPAEWGFSDQVAKQQSWTADVRFGSDSVIPGGLMHVR
jgi:hypothetical protein